MNDTDTAHDFAALYAVEALEPGERAVFEHHLNGCAHCQTEIAGYAEVRARLAEAVAQRPPPGLREMVLAAFPDAGRPAGTYRPGPVRTERAR